MARLGVFIFDHADVATLAVIKSMGIDTLASGYPKRVIRQLKTTKYSMDYKEEFMYSGMDAVLFR